MKWHGFIIHVKKSVFKPVKQNDLLRFCIYDSCVALRRCRKNCIKMSESDQEKYS